MVKLGAISITLLLFCGCAAEDEHFYPLSAGRIWHYNVARTTMDGTFKQKFIVETLPELQWRGTASVPMVSAGGEQYLYQRTKAATQRVAFKARHAKEFVEHTVPHIVLPEEILVGSTWQQMSHTKLLENTGPPWETLFRIAEPVTISFNIEHDDATVTVPAGTFHNCIKVSGFGGASANVGNYIGRTTVSIKVEQWYAPSIGLVKSIRTETSTSEAINHGKLILELEYSNN